MVETLAKKTAKLKLAFGPLPLFWPEHCFDPSDRLHHLPELTRFERKHVIGSEVLAAISEVSYRRFTVQGDVFFDVSLPDSGPISVNTFSNDVPADLVASAVAIARERR